MQRAEGIGQLAGGVGNAAGAYAMGGGFGEGFGDKLTAGYNTINGK